MEKTSVKFGPSQWNNDTPGKIKLAYQLIMFFSALWLLVQPQFPTIPASVCTHVDHILALGLPTLYLVCQCFGIPAPTNAGSPGALTTATAP